MGSSQKKAILRLHDGSWLSGYLPAYGFVRNGVEFLDLSARQQSVPLSKLKWICFVRDFNSGAPTNPERLERLTFGGRPRVSGLWLRLTLTDETVLEGITANDRSLLHPDGLFLIPPDTRSNTQRVFLPHSSIADLAVVAVIGAKATGSPAVRKPPAAERQGDLFPSASASKAL